MYLFAPHIVTYKHAWRLCNGSSDLSPLSNDSRNFRKNMKDDALEYYRTQVPCVAH